MEHGSRTKLITAAVLTIVFGSGLLVGFAADGGMGAEAAVPPLQGEPAAAPAATHTRRAPVYEQLDPTPEQSARIDEILKEHRDQMNQLHADFRAARAEYQAKYDAIIKDTREDIAQVFPPDEAAHYRDLLAEFDRAREQEHASQADRK